MPPLLSARARTAPDASGHKVGIRASHWRSAAPPEAEDCETLLSVSNERACQRERIEYRTRGVTASQSSARGRTHAPGGCASNTRGEEQRGKTEQQGKGRLFAVPRTRKGRVLRSSDPVRHHCRFCAALDRRTRWFTRCCTLVPGAKCMKRVAFCTGVHRGPHSHSRPCTTTQFV